MQKPIDSVDKYCSFLKKKIARLEDGKENYSVFLLDIFEETEKLLNRFGFEKTQEIARGSK